MKIQKIIEENKDAIILIDLQQPDKGDQKRISIRGTGFIISEDGKFITNAHVYKQIPENELQFLGVSVPGVTDDKNLTHYNRFSVKLLKLDEENDFALMQIVSDKKFKAITKMGDSEKAKEGDELLYIGYPLATEMLQMGFGITMTTNRCIISSVKRKMVDGSLHFFLIDTHANNGSSGSPVFSENGEVIGVVSGNISTQIPGINGTNGQPLRIPANIGICRPIKYAIDLINKK